MAAERDSDVRAPQAVSSDGAVYETATGRAEAHYYHFSHDKAGMGSVDKAKVAAVVHSMSEGSSFYRNEERRDARIQQQIEGMRRRWQALREGGLELEGAAATARRERAAMETRRRLDRVWVVVDMDMFFAAVEMRDKPELRDQPMAVGGTGMLSTANYAARKFGVRSAMPGFIALKLCPSLVIVRPNYDKYKAAAKLAKQVFRRFDPQCVALSLDEAYLDVTDAVSRKLGGLPAAVRRPQPSSGGASPAAERQRPRGGEAAVERGTGMLTSSSGGSAGRAAVAASATGRPGEAASRLLSDAAACGSDQGSTCTSDEDERNEPLPQRAAAGGRGGAAPSSEQAGSSGSSSGGSGSGSGSSGSSSGGSGSSSGGSGSSAPCSAPLASHAVVEAKAGQSARNAERSGQAEAAAPQQREGPRRYALLTRREAGALSSSQEMAAFHEAVWDVVAAIRRDVSVATGGLTCSAGAAPNAMLAKIASDMNKPDGQCLVPFDAGSILGFVGALPLRKLPGIGRVSETQLGGLGLRVVADVRDEAARLHCVLSPRMATWLHRVSLGIAESGRSGSEAGAQYRRKSISLERTFRDEGSLAALQATVAKLASKLSLQMQGSKAAAEAGSSGADGRQAEAGSSGADGRQAEAGRAGSEAGAAEDDGVQAARPPRGHVPGFFGMADSDSDSDDAGRPKVRPAMRGRTVTVKLRLASFKVLQRSATLAEPTNSAEVISAACKRLVAQESERFKAAHGGRPLVLRLLGVKMHGLVFDDDVDEEERAAAGHMCKLESFFGVRRAPPETAAGGLPPPETAAGGLPRPETAAGGLPPSAHRPVDAGAEVAAPRAPVRRELGPGAAAGATDAARSPAKRARSTEALPCADEVLDLRSDGSDEDDGADGGSPERADSAVVGQGRRPVLRAVLDERLRQMRRHSQQSQQQHPAKRARRQPGGSSGQRSLSGFVSIS